MTAQEFSSEFDLLYNNISSNQAPGLTEYEKSVLLTKAQDEIIKNYFTNMPGGNKYQQGIEDSPKRHADFSALLTGAELNAESSNVAPFDERGKIFKLPNGDGDAPKVMIVVTETFKTKKEESATTNLESYQVVPLKFNDYLRLMSKPSSDPLKKQVWKLMGNSEAGNGSIEIVPHWKDKDNKTNKLILKYIRKPYPIILEDLSVQGLTIENHTTPYSGTGVAPNYTVKDLGNGNYIIFDTANKVVVPGVYPSADEAGEAIASLPTTGTNQVCELAEELHPEILQRAVELAKVLYTEDNQQVLTAGTRSE